MQLVCCVYLSILCPQPLYVPWAAFGTGLKMAILFHASSSAVCVRPRQSSGKVKASVKDLNHPTEERFTLTGGTWKLVNKNTNRNIPLCSEQGQMGHRISSRCHKVCALEKMVSIFYQSFKSITYFLWMWIALIPCLSWKDSQLEPFFLIKFVCVIIMRGGIYLLSPSFRCINCAFTSKIKWSWLSC